MHLLTRLRTIQLITAAALLLTTTLVSPGAVDAHVLKNIGAYSVALGWKIEPTYLGVPNAVQVIVKDAKGNPIVDIPDGDLSVVVSIAGQSSASLPLNNSFDSDTGLGIQGDYEASIAPTVPGDYTFHLTGKIHGTAVDETATASDSTFDSVVDSGTVDFPTKLPSIADLTTRVDRIEARASAAPGASSGPDAATVAQSAVTVAGTAQSAADAAKAAATSAQDAASTALQVGILVGGIGIVIGLAALVLAIRRRSTAA